jgi:hypothetical protein
MVSGDDDGRAGMAILAASLDWCSSVVELEDPAGAASAETDLLA